MDYLDNPLLFSLICFQVLADHIHYLYIMKKKKKEDTTNCKYSTTAIAQTINLLSHLIDVLSKHVNFITKVFDIRVLQKHI